MLALISHRAGPRWIERLVLGGPVSAPDCLAAGLVAALGETVPDAQALIPGGYEQPVWRSMKRRLRADILTAPIAPQVARFMEHWPPCGFRSAENPSGGRRRLVCAKPFMGFADRPRRTILEARGGLT